MTARRTRVERGALIIAAAALGIVLWDPWQRRAPEPTTGPPATMAAAPVQPARRRAAAAIPRASTAREPWSISGEVRGKHDRALTGAVVCWTRGSAPPSPEACITTRAGRFSVERLDEGVTGLLVSANGHIGRALSVRAPEPPAPRRQDLTITLQPGGVEVAGRVADMSGGPIESALIVARSEADGPGAERGSAGGSSSVAFSGPDGRFAASTTEGPVRLTIQADSYASAAREVSAPVEGLLIGLVPSSSLIGEVVDAATGRGLAEMKVLALNRDGLRGGPFEVMTNADGSFEIHGVPAGGYELTARSPRFRSEPRWSHAGLASSSEPVVLHAQPATTLHATVRVGDAACLSGWVQPRGIAQGPQALSAGAAELEGLPLGSIAFDVACENPAAEALTEVVDLESEPVARLWVLEPANLTVEATCDDLSITLRVTIGADQVLGFLPTVLSSDTRGATREGKREARAFSFEGVCPGEHEVFLAEAPVARQTVEVTQRDRGGTIEVRLDVPHPEQLAGQVVDPSGLPAPDVWVRATPQMSSNGASNVPVLSDAEGRFVIGEVFGGIYGLSAESAAGRGELGGVRAGETDLVIRLRAHGSLHGSVTDGDGRSAPFTLWLRGGDETREIHGSGTWSAPWVLSGAYQIVATSPRGFAAAEVVLEPGAGLEVPLTLSPTSSGLPDWARGAGPVL